MDSPEWQLLSTFDSEVEARVVESFLRAQTIDVELLDTHMGYSRGAPRGFRLMVRAGQLQQALEMMREAQRPTHLEVVGELTAVSRSPVEKWIVLLLLLAGALVYVLGR